MESTEYQSTGQTETELRKIHDTCIANYFNFIFIICSQNNQG